MFHEYAVHHVQNLMEGTLPFSNIAPTRCEHFCIFFFQLQQILIYVKLSMGFLKVPLWGPDSFQFMLMTFQNEYCKKNYNCILTSLTAVVFCDSIDDVVRKVILLFAEICRRCNSNKLTLHTSQSEVMILRRNIFVGPLFPVQRGNSVLTKSLGEVIDNRLLWKEQVHKIIMQIIWSSNEYA